MAKTAVVIVDVQVGMFELPTPVWRGAELLEGLAGLVSRAREQAVPVFFVQHCGGDAHPLAPKGSGFPIHAAVAPQEGEVVVVKRYCDPFRETELAARLRAVDVGRLVVGGLQTELCVDTTCRRAASEGFDVVLASDLHSTYDGPQLSAEAIVRHHNQLVGAQFGRVRLGSEIRLRR